MNVHARNAYRWDGTQIDPDVVRQNEEHLDRLLRKARARNAAHGSEGPSLEAWPGSDFVWRPHLAEGAKTRRDHGTTKTLRRGTWLMRSALGLLLLMMTGVAFLPFGADVVKIVTAVL